MENCQCHAEEFGGDLEKVVEGIQKSLPKTKELVENLQYSSESIDTLSTTQTPFG